MQRSSAKPVDASAMIHETVITTLSTSGERHIAPMGIRRNEDIVLLQPFKPSRTYENVLQAGCAVVNFTTICGSNWFYASRSGATIAVGSADAATTIAGRRIGKPDCVNGK